jgi:hypothetical protein
VRGVGEGEAGATRFMAGPPPVDTRHGGWPCTHGERLSGGMAVPGDASHRPYTIVKTLPQRARTPTSDGVSDPIPRTFRTPLPDGLVIIIVPRPRFLCVRKKREVKAI